MPALNVGRPSNRDERYEQVMRALVQCVARFGLEGTTLSKVAEVSGLTRPLIRHHLGNRDQMMRQLQDYVLARFDEDVDVLVDALPQRNTAAFLVELLFSAHAVSDPSMTLAFAALTAQARSEPELQRRCREQILRMERAVARALEAEAEANAARSAAHGIIALYFNMTAFEALDMPQDWQARAKDVARSLIPNNGAQK